MWHWLRDVAKESIGRKGSPWKNPCAQIWVSKGLFTFIEAKLPASSSPSEPRKVEIIYENDMTFPGSEEGDDAEALTSTKP